MHADLDSAPMPSGVFSVSSVVEPAGHAVHDTVLVSVDVL